MLSLKRRLFGAKPTPRPPTEGIAVSGLTHTPAGAARPALREISMRLAPGEFIALLGHNGSGKSTLSRHLNGLIAPQAGSVRVDGLSTASPADLPAIRRRVGLIFQNPDHQIVGASVLEDVLWGMPAGLDPAEGRRRSREALAAVGLDGFEAHATWRLSGGQKQRLALAGVLARGPRYLVCDEPTALLDGASREEVKRLLLGCRDRGIGLLWITHRLEEALPADRLIVLKSGQIVAQGTPRELIGPHPEVVLTLPAPVALARRLRELGVALDPLPPSTEALADELAALLEATRLAAPAGGGR
ncbi:MAG TPA: ATP-binding cassette domain-containing protein [Dehalococcoidia bacterium]|nr:ATP-binding cassette domain-containing protein [Dehalococcoidia bacterium]